MKVPNIITRRTTRTRAWKALNVVVGLTTILNVTGIGIFFAVPRTAQAATTDVGTMTLDHVTNVSGSQWTANGTWTPQGNQCWTEGSSFHYRVYIFNDLNHNGSFNVGEKIAQVDPAACNGDYTDPVAHDDRGLGGDWPASGQADPTFNLDPGSFSICAALIHVNDNGNDRIDAVACKDVVTRPQSARIVATKIVCDNEADLPDWGAGGPDITSTTATAWVNDHQSCHLKSDWGFQYHINPADNPGDAFVGPAAGWTNFDGSTNAQGKAAATVTPFTGSPRVWVREVLKSGYLPFSHTGNDLTSEGPNGSAELYCNTDVINYDNFDFIDSLQDQGTYYCVAWNVKKTAHLTINKWYLYGNNDPIENPDGWTWNAGNDETFPGGVKETLNAGQYTISENPSIFNGDDTNGYWSCGNNDDDRATTVNVNGVNNPGTLGKSFPITLQPGDDKTCTFYNVAKLGSVKVRKVVIMNDQTLGASASNQWMFQYNRSESDLYDSAKYSPSLVNGQVITNLVGAYYLKEAYTGETDGLPISDLFTLTSATGSCSIQGSDNSGHPIIVLNVNQGQENPDCVITNTRKTGRVTGLKYSDLNGNGHQDEGEPGMQGVTIQLACSNFNGTLQSAFETVTNADGFYSFDNVPTGTCNVAEILPPNCHVTQGQSSDAIMSTDNPDYGKYNGIVVNDESPVRAIFGNQCGGGLKVNKAFDRSGLGQYVADNETANGLGFRWGYNGGETDQLMGSTVNLVSGSYSVQENTVPGYHYVGWFPTKNDSEWSCTNLPDNSFFPTNLSVAMGQTTEITLCNARDTGTITIIKNVSSPHGGSAKPGDFTMHITSGDSDAANFPGANGLGVTTALLSGTYGVNESGLPDGYMMQGQIICTNGFNDDRSLTTSLSIPGPIDPTHIVLTNGEHVTCTINNVDKPATLIVKKHVVSGTATAASFTIHVSGTNPSQTTFAGSEAGTTVTVDKGSFAITEDAVASYLGSNSTDCSGTIDIGQTKTCTITNTFQQPTIPTPTPTPPTKPALVALLGITKTNDINGFTNPGQNVTYTVVVTNAASATNTANTVVLSDQLPAGFSYTDVAGTTRSWNLGNIAPGTSVTTTYTATIGGGTTAGTYINTASAKGSNTATVSTTSAVSIRVPEVLGASSVAPDLTIQKLVTKADLAPGDTTTFTLIIKNRGDASATNVSIHDVLPAGLTFVDGGGTAKTWNIGTLLANHERQINYVVRVGATAKKGVYTNTATLSADGFDPLTAKRDVQVRQPQVLGLADTGVGLRDYSIFAFGLGLLAFGLTWAGRLRREQDGN